jgi:hypothetical protein
MAIQRPLKTYGTRSYVAEVAAAPNNTDPILASEVDADLDTMYTAFNALEATWTVSGGTLTPVDATKIVTISSALVAGARTIKSRLVPHPTADLTSLTINRVQDSAGIWSQDDATKPSWTFLLDSGSSDQCRIMRAPPGNPAATALLTVDSAGKVTLGGATVKGRVTPSTGGTSGLQLATNTSAAPWAQDDAAQPSWVLDLGGADTCYLVRWPPGPGAAATLWQMNSAGSLVISGANATKATGTTWINPSDIRLKRDVAPYAHGLADILQLEPISYTLVQGEQQTCGLDAEKVRAVFPECVGTTRMKLQPEDEEETEVLTLDIHPILIALINANKELAGRVAVLEGVPA